MADRWTDDRDREWRDRDVRRSEPYSLDERGEARRWAEERTWAADDRDLDDETGGYRRGYGERAYGGRSGLASYQGRHDAGRARFSSMDYTGRRYADEATPAEYDYQTRRFGPQGGARRRWEDEGERGYDRGRERRFGDADRDRWDDGPGGGRGEGSTDFLQRAGERIGSWFRGDNLMRGSRDEAERDEPRRYSADFGREDRWEVPGRGHRGRGPRGYTRSDERIIEEVHERLTEDPWLDATNIDVEVKSREVTLSGHVDNREAKHRAERLVEDIAGVENVQNNLRINPDAGLRSAGGGYGSSALEAQMRREAMARDPGDGAETERSTGMAADPKPRIKP
jgi:hypothetical protein